MKMHPLRKTPLKSLWKSLLDANSEFCIPNLPGHGRESYTVRSTDYELPIEAVEDGPQRRERVVELSPGKEIYKVIQVVPKGEAQIEASVESTLQGGSG